MNSMLSDDDKWFELKNRRLLLELSAILNNLTNRYNDNYELHRIIEFIKNTKIEFLEKVFLSPEGRQWISYTYRSIKDSNNSDSHLTEYSKWLAISQNKFQDYQVNKLKYFTASLVVLSKKSINARIDLKIPMKGYLPGIDLYWKNSKNIQLAIDNSDVVVLGDHGSVIINEKNYALLNANGFYELPKSNLFPFAIDLHSEASRVNFPGREHLDRQTADNDLMLENQVSVIETALSYIKKANKDVFNYFSKERNYFVPLQGPDGALPSSSNSSVDTMIWYSATSNPLLVAEMIMHENSHQRLFRLQDIDPLIDSENHGSGWDTNEFYSPWRDDPRPVNGVLHGLVVFSEASKFWFDLIQSGELNASDLSISERRMAMLVLQLKYADESLSKCRFTDKGRKLITYYAELINSTLLPYVMKNNLGNLSPLFMEHHDQLELTGSSIKKVVDNHKSRWVSAHE